MSENEHFSPAGRGLYVLIILLIVFAGLFPVILYGLFFGPIPAVTAQEAQELLNAPGSRALLVDVRTPEEFEAGHVERSENWPYASIRALSSSERVPGRFRDKPLLLICNSGIDSARAVRKLETLSVEARNVEGGMQAWVVAALGSDEPAFSVLQTAAGEIKPLPYRELPIHEQLAAVVAALLIKPLYTLLSLLLIIVLAGSRSTDLKALLWGLIFFFTGEMFCALATVSFFIHNKQSELFEFLHGLGMVLCMGLVAFALLDGVDRRILKYSDPRARCAVLGLCRSCSKHADVSCGLWRSFLLVSPVLTILAFMPLVALPHMVSYNTEILGVAYNYSHPGILQIFEIRYCPLLAIGLLSTSFLVLVFKKNPTLLAKVFLAAGLGPLAFGLLRLVLLTMYRDTMVWFVFWEEATELLFVVGAGFFLWAFRRGFFQDEKRPLETQGKRTLP